MPPSTAIELKEQIQTALAAFAAEPLPQAARALFDTLGYNSQRDERVLKIATPADFIGWVKSANPAHPLTEKDNQELTSGCKSLHFLYQLTDMEVGSALGLSQADLFESSTAVDGARIESYLVFVVELSDNTPRTRTSLSRLVRLINKPLPMPALVLFRHGDTLTLGIINRRLHKKASDRDVLEKITLIKDIFFADPLRAHIEILHDLSLGTLHDEYRFHNFVGLHQAWEKRLGSYALNERFYREVANWYFWALNNNEVVLPRSVEEIDDTKERDKQRSIFFIRLLTRLIFCWFLQEKRLIPRDMFRHRTAKELLKDFSPKAGSYYRVFLQNLFFATLNQEQDKRDWRKKYQGTRDGNRGVTNLWRYQDLVNDFNRIELLLRDHIPFVNGGLFECLDDQFSSPMVFLDGFSERKDNGTSLPNELFFGEEREVDLSTIYDDKRRKREKVRGLIEILSRYKFTVEENTPLEEEIALDPELLGKVFENLLASYNEDTRTTARKALGAFYTPREIVGYMVDDSLSAYLENQLVIGLSANTRRPVIEYREMIKKLFTSQPEHFHNPFTPTETAILIAAIGRVKILDPACGSGAFPMGALHRLVDLLQKLDPNNESWKRDRLAEAERYCDILREAAAQRDEVEQCEARIEDIRHSFDTRFHALDFARKLYLIENCIYGVDIQPIAVQIAKLRFFIALIVDQHVNQQAPNMGVRPLPNLETKIVAADSLIPIEKQMGLFESEIRPLRQQLEQIRHDHFNARTPTRKAKCRERDAQLRADIAKLLQQSGWDPITASKLATWNPYDQNHAATFFDSEWMFGLPIGKVKIDGGSSATLLGRLALINETPGQLELMSTEYVMRGFDIVIGNPPYGIKFNKEDKQNLSKIYLEAKKVPDSYCFFTIFGMQILKDNGVLTFIIPNTFCDLENGDDYRRYLLKNYKFKSIWQSGWAFSAAVVDTIVMVLCKEQVSAEYQFPVILENGTNYKIQRSFIDKPLAKIDFRINEESEKLTREIYNRCNLLSDEMYVKAGVKMYELGKGDPPQTEHTGKERPFSSTIQHPGWKPLYRGTDIAPFLLKNPKEYVNYGPWLAAPRSADLFEPIKILMRRTDDKLRSAIDDSDSVCVNSCHVIKFKNSKKSLNNYLYILAILNSKVCQWVFEKNNPQMVNKTFAEIKVVYVERLPIPNATSPEQNHISEFVKSIIWLNKYFDSEPNHRSSRDALMLGYFEQVLNGMVYELYFPDELHSRNLNIFDYFSETNFPILDTVLESSRLDRMRNLFETIYHTDHPLRGALFNLGSLEIVGIIEGRE